MKLLPLLLPFASLATILVACGGTTAETPAQDGQHETGDAGADATPDAPTGTIWHEPAVHRASAVTCDQTASPAPLPPADAGDGPCTTDADCAANQGVAGHCRAYADAGGAKRCDYDACFVDADCGASEACSCWVPGGWASRTPWNKCVPSNCRVDADCGAGGYCSPTVSPDCGSFYGTVGFYCHTKQDECIDDVDCKNAGDHCSYRPEVGHWTCESGVCAG